MHASFQSFASYCDSKQPEFLPLNLNRVTYGFSMLVNGDIAVDFRGFGHLKVPASRLAEVESDLKALLSDGCSFVTYQNNGGRKNKTIKARNISTLIK